MESNKKPTTPSPRRWPRLSPAGKDQVLQAVKALQTAQSTIRRTGDAHCLHCEAFLFYISAALMGWVTCPSCGWGNFFGRANVPSETAPPETIEPGRSTDSLAAPGIQSPPLAAP